MNEILISIVDHGHGDQTVALVEQLLDQKIARPMTIIVTINSKNESPDLKISDSRLKIILNENKKSFSENHNTAFSQLSSKWFIALNPDIDMLDINIGDLITSCENLDSSHGIFITRVINHDGVEQEMLRSVPTPFNLINRYLRFERDARVSSRHFREQHYLVTNGPIMLFKSSAFLALKGFDEKFRLYCEDIDISLRATQSGFKIGFLYQYTLMHQAQKRSHKDIQLFYFHISSLIKLWCSIPMIKYLFKLK